MIRLIVASLIAFAATERGRKMIAAIVSRSIDAFSKRSTNRPVPRHVERPPVAEHTVTQGVVLNAEPPVFVNLDRVEILSSLTHPCDNAACETRVDDPGLCFQCKGDRNLSDRQRAYLAAVDALGLDQFPHCDPLILHTPSTCTYCDLPKFGPLHDLRLANIIAWSNEQYPSGLYPEMEPCPSTAFRSPEVRDRWGGNVPA